MHIPSSFEVTDETEIIDFIKANGFGQLISTINGKLCSTHLPFLLSEDGSSVLAHLALNNPQHEGLEGQEVLVTLEGPHDYISPSWYYSPGVPTWNYQAVHIYGTCSVFRGADRLQQLVNSLTDKYEAAFDRPWQPDYRSSMLGAIVGVEIKISELQCQYKLSQNRSIEDRTRVVKQLKRLGSDKLANVMECHVLS